MPTANALVKALQTNRAEVATLVAQRPDWAAAAKRFDAFHTQLADPKDPLFSAATMKVFADIYYTQRDKDGGMSNIVTRTVPALPKAMQEDAKLIFLRMAEACTFFNGQHKVNFTPEELPAKNPVAMAPGKAKGTQVMATPLPALYPKTSLTFDYWVPKLLELMEELRTKGLRTWRGEAILQHESCTDFMRTALLFLNDPKTQPPIAKAEEREKLLALLGTGFVWVKKSVKREDILANSRALAAGLNKVASTAGVEVPLEAWGRILRASFAKQLLA